MTAGDSTLDDVRRALYAGPRSTFVERRRELARGARSGGDRIEAKLIGEMRKPTAAAHIVNLLAQADDSSLQELVELGASIRGAMAKGDGGMRSLLQGRTAAIAKTLAQARRIARANGESVSGAVGDQIVQTLRAAMASDEAAAAALGGTLSDVLDEPGFGGVTVQPAAQAPVSKASAGAKGERNAEVAVDRAANEAAERAGARARIRSATAEVKRAEKALAATTKRHDGLRQKRDRLASQLAQIEEELTAARAEVDDADGQLLEATAELEAAGETPH